MKMVMQKLLDPARRAKGRLHQWRADRARAKLLRQDMIEGVDPEELDASLRDPTRYYYRAFQDYHRTLPEALRAHRDYFSLNRRGFGEDAFHTMWWRLIRRYQPKTFLEIGVYRGQTISLVALIARLERITCDVTGISPFTSAGDSVSDYSEDIDYHDDTLRNFQHFDLGEPRLVRALSTEPEALDVIRERSWDCIYIDGNHDYEVVQSDWSVCAKAVAPGGLIVLDDAGLNTDYQPPPFATKGHPGPSQLASEIDRTQFGEILQVGHNRVFQKSAS